MNGKGNTLLKAFLGGIVLISFLWLITWLITTKVKGAALFTVLVIFTGIILIVPMVRIGRIEEEYHTMGLYSSHGVVQGVFTVVPFYADRELGFCSGYCYSLYAGTGGHVSCYNRLGKCQVQGQ